jgi:hypothetical protein
VVGEAYLQEYADMPWVSLAKSPTRSDNKNRRQVGGKAANNTLSRRWSETPGSKQQQGHRGGHSYGEFQLQELPAPDVLKKRKELDNNYDSNLIRNSGTKRSEANSNFPTWIYFKSFRVYPN